MKGGNFGKRESPQGPRPERDAKEEKPRIDPKEHMQLLRGIGDEALNELLTRWEDLQASMVMDPVHDDAKVLENLLGQLNARLAKLHKLPVLREDLP